MLFNRELELIDLKREVDFELLRETVGFLKLL